MADIWEQANGLNPASAADGELDSDGDGVTNLQEYRLPPTQKIREAT